MSPFDLEICDQLWILDRVCQKYFFLLLFGLCGCLELLNRKSRVIREHIKKTSVSVLGEYTNTWEEKLFPALVHLGRPGCGGAFS